MHFDSDEDLVDEIRERSNRFVQIIFTLFTIVFIGLGLMAHHAPAWFPLPEGEPRYIADSFLCLGSAYALTLFVWEWIYRRRI